jgi:ankyrin repeat protein
VVDDLFLDTTTSAQAGKNKTLLLAAEHDSLATLAGRLIAGGAEVDAAHPGDGLTPMCIACEHGNVAMVERLIVAGADVNKAGVDGSTPLHLAAEAGHADVVAVLIDAAGVDLNAAVTGGDFAGLTPLFLAAQENRLDVLKLLVAAGADVNKARVDGFTPLHIAAQFGHAGVVSVLIENAGVDLNAAMTGNEFAGVTALFLAAKNNQPEVVTLLVAAGADVNTARVDDGCTPLHFAAQDGHAGVIAVLIEAAGVDLNAALTDGAVAGVTPSYLAAQENRLDVLKLLVATG